MPTLEQRLWEAFSAECGAYMKYSFFADAARKEGYGRISEIFDKTAANEKAHARIWFRQLNLLHDGTHPGDTLQNLHAAAHTEHMEWETQYKECADAARQENQPELAHRFDLVAAIEADHEKIFLRAAKELENNTEFEKPEQMTFVWRCRHCGYLYIGPAAPDQCPVCNHPKAYFEPANE